MTDRTISHVGIAVRNLDSAIKTYALLTGDTTPVIEEISEQKVRLALFSGSLSNAGGRVELLEATSPDSPIARFIDRRGEGLHHICVYVDDIKAKLSELKAAGVKLIDETPRIGAGGAKIAFVHPSGTNGVLLELEEKTTSS
jgi:methylmalonyl-CoA/ethylmalonyl-CoA epimerase